MRRVGMRVETYTKASLLVDYFAAVKVTVFKIELDIKSLVNAAALHEATFASVRYFLSI